LANYYFVLHIWK